MGGQGFFKIIIKPYVLRLQNSFKVVFRFLFLHDSEGHCTPREGGCGSSRARIPVERSLTLGSGRSLLRRWGERGWMGAGVASREGAPLHGSTHRQTSCTPPHTARPQCPSQGGRPSLRSTPPCPLRADRAALQSLSCPGSWGVTWPNHSLI